MLWSGNAHLFDRISCNAQPILSCAGVQREFQIAIFFNHFPKRLVEVRIGRIRATIQANGSGWRARAYRDCLPEEPGGVSVAGRHHTTAGREERHARVEGPPFHVAIQEADVAPHRIPFSSQVARAFLHVILVIDATTTLDAMTTNNSIKVKAFLVMG